MICGNHQLKGEKLSCGSKEKHPVTLDSCHVFKGGGLNFITFLWEKLTLGKFQYKVHGYGYVCLNIS